MDDDLTNLDKAGLLAASSEAVRARRLAEVRDLKVLLAVGSRPTRASPTHPRDRLMELAGEGAPQVQEFCLGEIALARGTGATATVNALVDVLGPGATGCRGPGRSWDRRRRASTSPAGSRSSRGTCPPR